MLQAIAQYKSIKASIPMLLEVSGYRNDFVARKIGMKPGYFSVKKQRGNWSDNEVEKLVKVLTSANTEVQDYLDSKMIDEMNTGKRVSSEEFKKSQGWI